jgi:mannosyltransferase
VTTVLEQSTGRATTPALPKRSNPVRTAVAVGLPVAALIGIALRFWTRSELWLDEALTVNIARLPLSQIPGALRHDGAPPLYYVLLHLWMLMFGSGNVAVRSLSGAFSVAVLPLVWVAGRKLRSSEMAWAAGVLLLTSPFAIRYATETRMYSLVVLLATAGLIVLLRALEGPTLGRLVAVAAVTALLLYTHYWAFYLLATVGAWLVFRAWTARSATDRNVALRVVGAMAVGSALFVPWLPTFLFQAAHTGTPWANPAGLPAVASVVPEFAGGDDTWTGVLTFMLFTLLVLGVFGRPLSRRRIELDLRGNLAGRPLAGVILGTTLLAIIAGLVSSTVFVARYLSVIFPLFILLVALGATVLIDRRARYAALAVTAALGLIVGFDSARMQRTQAPEVASVLNAAAAPGDVVAYCPDQLGPAVNRLMRVPVTQITYPRLAGPDRVNWVDYTDAIQAESPQAFASVISQRAGRNAVWLVWRRGYEGFGKRCTTVLEALQDLRPGGTEVVPTKVLTVFEHEALVRFP